MDKHVAKTAKTLLKNVGKHAKRVFMGRESIRDAVDGISDDADRLKRVAKGSKAPGDHRRAAQYVEKGRRAYNEKDFARAEEYFHQAIVEDPNYALAYTYLGSTYYQMQRLTDAQGMWAKAIAIDPGSDAAAKAQQRLRRVQHRKEQVIADIERSIRGE
ncbi:MAG: tetratricopeptide repeat protein [Candidatus Hydrogenedentes bacterium]|nr:tetratricopeptide repeat protein [Candidatus Hydrogenedentota bacterium]